MITAISYHPGDESQFHEWVKWAAELGAGAKHDLIVLPFKGLTPPEIKGWKSVTILRDYVGLVSDWQSNAAVRDCGGPNHIFRDLARRIHEKHNAPWLFMEPDAILLTATAIDDLERAYLATGRRYLGARVQAGNTPAHMSGVAVYPGDLAVTAPNYMQPRLAQFGERLVEVAFNLAGAPDALPEMQATRLIQQETRHPAFTEPFAARALIENGRAIFHSDKSHSLIQLLRKAGDAKCAAPVMTDTPQATGPSVPSIQAASNGAAVSHPPPAPDPDWQAKFEILEARLSRVENALAIKQRLVAQKHDVKPRGKRMTKKRQRTPAQVAADVARMAKVRAAWKHSK